MGRLFTPRLWYTTDIADEGEDAARLQPAANTNAGNLFRRTAFSLAIEESARHAGQQVRMQERNFRILDALIELTQQMVEGELLQIEKLGLFISQEEYFDLIYRKTACLFSVCMRLGAILGGATPQQEEAVGNYGRNLGMAFQIVDDVLDLTASEDVLGKPVASDLREGKVTMAVIHALERATLEERSKVEKVLNERGFNGVTHAQILAMPKHVTDQWMPQPPAPPAKYAESAVQVDLHLCRFRN